MKKIQLLDDNMINKIAAGEVVERPVSVVKELVENSIDAGATRIIIEIENGGIDMIRISDNGSGIPESDVLSAFMRHATSKIRNMDDLENVLTLGFRGEGLSSVAAVSQVEIITKPKEQEMAKILAIHGGKVINESFVGATEGTSLTIRNLFYNTPARRKFLKKPGTEAAQISDMVSRIILARPDISFKYIVNSIETINTAEGGNLQSAVLSVYGRDVAKSLIGVNELVEGIEISGFLGKPEISRGKRTYGNIFINGRYIKSQLLERAIEEAYKNRLTVGKFPVYILNLKIDPTIVDVNVHPQKLEIRFSDERLIYNAFYNAAFDALKREVLIPEVKTEEHFQSPVSSVFQSEKQDWVQDNIRTFDKEREEATQKPHHAINMNSVMNSLFNKAEDVHKNAPLSVNETVISESYNYYENIEPQKVDCSVKEQKSKEQKPIEKGNTNITNDKAFFNSYNIVGQFLATYWLIEQDEEIYLIDQHAGHERVVFERLLNQYRDSYVASQTLVDPMIVNLSDKESVVIDENSRLFSRFGYNIEHMGINEYAIKSVPFIFGEATNISLFMQILDKLSEHAESVTSIFDEKLRSIATIACKAAVKANDRIHINEARKLIEELLTLENPFNCPHGRPTIVKLTKTEIEKMFKRIQ